MKLPESCRRGSSPVLIIALLAMSEPAHASAADRHTRNLETLPPAIRSAVSHGPVSDWWSAVDGLGTGACDSLLTRVEHSQLHRIPWEGALSSGQVRERRAWGMLMPSPDSTYWLDPLAGYDVEEEGEVGVDADTGFEIYERSTGDRSYSWVTTSFELASAAWADSFTVVLVGFGLDWEPGRQWPYRYPELWVVHANNGQMERYVGSRISSTLLPGWNAAIGAIRKKSFPRLRWSE